MNKFKKIEYLLFKVKKVLRVLCILDGRGEGFILDKVKDLEVVRKIKLNLSIL